MHQLLIILVCITTLCWSEAHLIFGSLKNLNPKSDERIIGGTDAKLGEFPWQAALQTIRYVGSTIPYTFCSGTIISPRTILTTGNCIRTPSFDPEKEHLQIQVGLNNIITPGENVQTRLIVNTTEHRGFNGGSTPNDIAIYTLDQPLEFNQFVKSINLPEKNVIPTGDAILSGWGSLGFLYPAELQRVSLPIVEFDECLLALDGYPLDKTQICTGPLVGGKGPCVADAGDPLVQLDGNNATLVGIVSYGFYPCAQPDSPSVYTSVSSFIDWINEHTVN